MQIRDLITELQKLPPMEEIKIEVPLTDEWGNPTHREAFNIHRVGKLYPGVWAIMEDSFRQIAPDEIKALQTHEVK